MSQNQTTKKKTTIYDIAQAAGASPSTVSMALTDSWKKQRISEKTVERIRKIASEKGYSVNRQARGLRQAKSGIVGMILPEHENRFFSELSQAFALEARKRSLCPAIVFSGRDAETQFKSLESLVSFSVDYLVIAGAENPTELSNLCQKFNVPHVFVDHPHDESASVVTDNRKGARELADRIFERAENTNSGDINEIYFMGGVITSPATRERIAGLKDAARERGIELPDEAIRPLGYEASIAYDGIADLYNQLGRLPNSLIVNSITCFEGVVRFLGTLPEQEIMECTVGCYDFDPFATILRFPVSMVHQRADLMAAKAFEHIDNNDFNAGISLIPTDLIG